MAKAPIQIYVRTLRDACSHEDEDGFICGKPKRLHGSFDGMGRHRYRDGAPHFVYPTDAERRKIYKQLKEEFDD